MKKLLAILFVSILLTGCGTTAKKDEKTCKIAVDEVGLDMEVTVTKAEADKIKDLELTMKAPSLTKVLHMDEEVSEEDLKKLEQQMINEINTEVLPGVGADITFTDDNIICKAKIDLENVDERVLQYINYKEALTYSEYITRLESVGFTCK